MDENNRFQGADDWNPVPPPDPTAGAAPSPEQPADAQPLGAQPPIPPQEPPVPPAPQPPYPPQPFGQQPVGSQPVGGQPVGGQPVNGGFQGGQTPPPYPPQPGFNGQPGYIPYNSLPPQQQKLPGDSMAVAAMVLGIVGLLCCGGGIVSILGIIFGFMARSKGTSKEGMALAGIILGFIGLVGGIVISIVFAATGALEDLISNSSYSYYY